MKINLWIEYVCVMNALDHIMKTSFVYRVKLFSTHLFFTINQFSLVRIRVRVSFVVSYTVIDEVMLATILMT
jgi:hypothetical protein